MARFSCSRSVSYVKRKTVANIVLVQVFGYAVKKNTLSNLYKILAVNFVNNHL